MSSFHHVIISSCHHFIMSSFHHFIISSCHHFIMSSFHHVIISSCHHFIMSLIHHVINSSCHHVINSSFHPTSSSIPQVVNCLYKSPVQYNTCGGTSEAGGLVEAGERGPVEQNHLVVA